MRVRRGGSLESNCKIRWRTSGASTSRVATSGWKVEQGRQPRSNLGLGIFHNLSENRRILHFFPCKQTGGERRVVLGLGGFQEAAPIYRNPVAKSRRACARALGCRRGRTLCREEGLPRQAGGGRRR